MAISDLIGVKDIVLDLEAASKKQLLQELSNRIAANAELDRQQVFETLSERESLGSTGMGAGVAVPHGKILGLDRVWGLFVRLKSPVDFGALDDRPVELVFLLLAPEDARAQHLEALSCVSRRLRCAADREMLRRAATPQAAYDILTASVAVPADAAA